ncbi:tumor necrosis factor receptor superfamily member 11A-like isoform X1 [Arapaima gigas]
MNADCGTSWFSRLALLLCAQMVCSRPSCSYLEYQGGRTCCKKCPPGTYALQLCNGKSGTICRPCGSNEYQPDWNTEPRCLPQKYCDKGQGFDPVRPENRTAPVPCRCQPGRQCFLVNCEYCEKLQVCPPGHGFTRESSGRGSCKPCTSGHFSNVSSATEPCKPWTDCKALGKAVHQLGTQKTDAVCRPHVAGASTLWVAAVVLSFIVVVSLAVLFLFLYRDRWKDLSVNIRTCVQNLKSRTVHQETSPAASHSSRGQSCVHEVLCLMDVEKKPPDTDAGEGAVPCVASEPEPPAAPPRRGSCICGLSSKEPLEVGENEDCSQAVATCPCDHRGVAARAPALLSQGDGADVRGPCNLCADSHGWEREACASGGEAGGTCRQKDSADSTAAPQLPSVSDNNLGLPLYGTRDPTLGAEADLPSHGLASGHVTGNGNTTFISTGQVMNFSGEVLVVYVNQEALGSGTEPEGDFSRPVQEELPRSGAPQADP